MKDVLKNPAWNALITGDENLSNGTESVKYFSPKVSPFAGLIENTKEHFEMLYDIISFDNPVGIFSNQEPIVPACWKITRRIVGLQMIYPRADVPVIEDNAIVPLSEVHVPQMLQLAGLTNPGPFAAGTINFGNYEGIFDGERLIAMAGQRLHTKDYIEISAVCTHPDYIGRGYARKLMMSQVHTIKAEGHFPYLHVRSDNSRAIKMYKDLKFETGDDITIFIIEKNK